MSKSECEYLLRNKIKFHPQTTTKINHTVGQVGADGEVFKGHFIIACVQIGGQESFVNLKLNLN